MQDDLIRKIAELMAEQSAAYTSLRSLTTHLIAALTRCEPLTIDSLSRSGETELLRMRARLLDITSALAEFGQVRSREPESLPLNTEVREAFEAEANKLVEAAREYEKLAGRAASLALGGSTFASANIQMCGIPPSTYRPPVLAYGRGATA